MAERSFAKEVEMLRLGDGDELHGEGILAVTKALLQSGVSYIGGYQGSPISHLIDVFADAREILEELGVHFEQSASEAAAASMLAASINYPLRGAVAWKSTVGTNVASDALANVASAGVKGGVLIIVGEDYGEGASIMQERSHAFAMKSQMWLLDPRPNLNDIAEMVEKGFELSEASCTPVMMQLRVRACHVYGVLNTKDNRQPAFSVADALDAPTRDIERIILPPYNYQHEVEKTEQRWPAAVKFIEDSGLNDVIDGRYSNVGIIVPGGLYNTLNRAMEHAGCSDTFGNTSIPMYVMNVAYPVIDAELIRFCQTKKAVLMVEEGQPDYLEQNINTILRRNDVQTRVHGKDVFSMAGEYTCHKMEAGLRKFLLRWEPSAVTIPPSEKTNGQDRAELAQLVPQRPSGLCTGCPERPFFSAVKLLEKEFGKLQVSMDIGCHSFATLDPFNIGNTITGYGLGPSSASAFMAPHRKRALSVMGDGGFWHNGLTSGIGNAVENEHDGIIVVVDNGYSAATGGQWIPSSRADAARRQYRVSIVDALKGAGVKWIRKVHTYNIQESLHALREAMTTRAKGPKLIVAEGECQLNRQRRIKPQIRNLLKQKKRYVRERFGIDEDTCTGDHSCIRLSGCPSLTIKDNPDPLRKDPVATVVNSCVGCGVCGEVAHAAVLCPSFYKADIVYNPNLADRALAALRAFVIGKLQAWSDVRRRKRAFEAVPPHTREQGSGETQIYAHAAVPPHAREQVKNWTQRDSALGAVPPHAREQEGHDSFLPVRKQEKLSAEATASQADKRTEPIKVAILAMGGQGGGVLSNWLIQVAERSGYLAQSTSVPGVAQRTGATVYYLEFFPREAIGDSPPVLALMPVPGHVDVIIAGELVEGGRAILRGLITPERTTALVSTHRDYAIGEKTAMGDGRADTEKIASAMMENARRFIGFDMDTLAGQTGSVISSVLLGAAAGSGALPFPREVYTAIIAETGVAVEANLKGFHAGYKHAQKQQMEKDKSALAADAGAAHKNVQALLDRIHAEFPAQTQEIVRAAISKLSDYQDVSYAEEYLRRLQPVLQADRSDKDYRLSVETARYLALWMAYEDAIRVADLKIRTARFARVRKEVQAEQGQVVTWQEFMHPRVQEICDIMLAWKGSLFMNTPLLRNFIGLFCKRGRKINTTSVTGFLLLYLLAGLRVMRRSTLRYKMETAAMETWLASVLSCAATDYDLAVEVAECQRLVKGYGETHARGKASFDRIMGTLEALRNYPNAAARVRELRKAALADEQGEALKATLKKVA